MINNTTNKNKKKKNTNLIYIYSPQNYINKN